MQKTPILFPLFLSLGLAACAAPAKKDEAPKPAAPAAAAAKPAEKTPGKADPMALVTCMSASETRTLSIGTKENGCKLHYEKGGKPSVVATSASGTKHCEETRAKIRKKLETAGWKCGE